MNKLIAVIVVIFVGFVSWYGYQVISIAKENAAAHAQQLKAIELE